MGSNFAKAAIESSFRCRVGASEETRERLKEANVAAKNWYGICPHCGRERTGTMAELRLPHDCEVKDG